MTRWLKVGDSRSTDSPLPPRAEQKVEEMEGVWSKVQEEIQGLQAERAVLLAQLEKIELSLTKSQARRVSLLQCDWNSARQSELCQGTWLPGMV